MKANSTIGFTDLVSSSESMVYFLMFKSDARGTEIINSLKAEFDELFPGFEAKESQPHITLFHRRIPKLSDTQILEYLEKALASIAPFEFRFSGFAKFGRHTLYIALEDDGGFLKVGEALRSEHKALKCIRNPHLTIARKVKGKDLELAHCYFQDQRIEHSFTVDKVYLFKAVSGVVNVSVGEVGLGGKSS